MTYCAAPYAFPPFLARRLKRLCGFQRHFAESQDDMRQFQNVRLSRRFFCLPCLHIRLIRAVCNPAEGLSYQFRALKPEAYLKIPHPQKATEAVVLRTLFAHLQS